MIEYEFEEKATLTAEEFNSLKENISNLETKTFTTYIFETTDFFFKKKYSTARIRHEDGKYMKTLKVKDFDKIIEYSEVITEAEFEQIKKTMKITFNNAPVGFNHELELGYLYYYQTTRYQTNHFKSLLMLDQTLFQDEFTDYEVEIEASSLKAAKNTLIELLAKHGITYQASSTKTSRLFNYLKK
ncbi:MAG: CYTH domain-containing protein [Mycoplasmatales bacterium]